MHWKWSILCLQPVATSCIKPLVSQWILSNDVDFTSSYTVPNLWHYPIRHYVTFANALEILFESCVVDVWFDICHLPAESWINYKPLSNRNIWIFKLSYFIHMYVVFHIYLVAFLGLFDIQFRHPDKSVYLKIIFLILIFQPKHMLWVLKRTVSLRWFFWAPKTHV